ncbi:MAG: ABC transporter permease [Chloroflexi bacterium]|nr:ABC transporter permease [Chloroflexota bacterium]
MRNYIIRRLFLLVPIMLGVSFLTFAVFRLIPGDAAILTLGFGSTPESLEDLRHELGIDRPWYEQYGDWVWGVVQGDFGESITESGLSVTTELGRRLPITLELLVLAIFFSVLLGVPPGVLSAIRPGTALDFVARIASVLWLSIPNFWLGILVITFGLAWFGWTPPQFGEGYVPFFAGLPAPLDGVPLPGSGDCPCDPWVNLQQFFFPSLVLALGIAAAIMRLTRSAMMEVLRNDYIRTAWSKGLRERTVVSRHALKNALIPVVTVVGLQVGALIGGTVLVERVFALNGVGFWVVESVIRRDIFVVMSLTLIFALTYVLANLFVDITYAWLDPRIRYA